MTGSFRTYLKILLMLFAFSVVRAGNFEILQFGKGADNYSIFIPATHPDTCEVVLFLHGHGASNALVYGSWIKHLLEEGKIVIFPKYQTGWFIPVVSWSQRRASKALTESLVYLMEERKLPLRTVHVIGHSLGGAIGANIVATVELPGSLKFGSLALVEPGCWLFKSGRLKSYASLPDSLRLMCITGRRDFIAGKRMATFVMRHSPGLSDSSKVHLQVVNRFHNGQSIHSSHLEPAGADLEMDTHNRNLFIRAAKYICFTNLSDKRAFWNPVDQLMNRKIPLYQCGDMGFWKDGTAIGSLRIVQYK